MKSLQLREVKGDNREVWPGSSDQFFLPQVAMQEHPRPDMGFVHAIQPLRQGRNELASLTGHSKGRTRGPHSHLQHCG